MDLLVFRRVYHALHFRARQDRPPVVQGVHLDPLGLPGTHVHDEFVALLTDDQVLVPEPARHEERFAHRILLGERLGVLFDPGFHRLFHLAPELEEPVRRDKALDPLMRPLEIVVLDPMADSLNGVLERFKDRLLQKLPPEMPPERLDLAERLRMMRSGSDVPDPALLQDLLESRLAPPRVILPPVVGQNLLRKPVFAYGAEKDVAHRLARLLAIQTPADDES